MSLLILGFQVKLCLEDLFASVQTWFTTTIVLISLSRKMDLRTIMIILNDSPKEQQRRFMTFLPVSEIRRINYAGVNTDYKKKVMVREVHIARKMTTY